MDGGQCFITAVIQSWTNSCKYTAKTANISKRRVSWDPVVDTVPVTMIQIQTAASSSSYVQQESEHQSLMQTPFTPGNAGDQNMQYSSQAAPTQLGSQQTDSEGAGRVWSCRAVKSGMSGESAQLHSPPKSPSAQSMKPGENPVIAGRPKDRPMMPQHLLAPSFHDIGTPPGPGNCTGSPGRRPWLDEYMDATFPNPSNPNPPCLLYTSPSPRD